MKRKRPWKQGVYPRRAIRLKRRKAQQTTQNTIFRKGADPLDADS